jgi:hypothetical protein
VGCDQLVALLQPYELPNVPPLTPERLRRLAPFYHLVPKTIPENLEWRRETRQRANRDPKFAAAVREMCRRDVLFYINGFVWTLDPRAEEDGRGPNDIPMITWPSQDQVILELRECLGKYDFWGEKSREQGASWDAICVIDHSSRFHRNRHYLLASWKENLVDDGNNPDTLFAKFDFIQDHLPKFLQGDRDRRARQIKFQDTNSTIVGESTQENIGRAGRKTAAFIDEFPAFGVMAGGVMAATASVTNCRIFIGTHQGTGTEFYRNIQTPGKKVIRIHWTTHPRHIRGLYTSKDGKLEILDKGFRGKVRIEATEYNFPEDYPFILDGRLRSPWYDNMCSRLGHDKVRIAGELDISPTDSASTVFDSTVLDKLIALARSRPVVHRVRPVVDWLAGELLDMVDDDNGELRLWAPRDLGGKMPEGDYILGIDVAVGEDEWSTNQMSSNSVISIGNKWLRDKVGELATKKLSPEELAVTAYALGYWLSSNGEPAKIIWEDNGPGKQFKRKLLGMGYPHIFMRPNLDRQGVPNGDVPGWWSGPTTKRVIFGKLSTAYRMGTFLNPSPEALEEARHYIYTNNNSIQHSMAITAPEAKHKNDNHGDRVVADALLWYEMEGVAERPSAPKSAPVGSLAFRREQRANRRLATALW